DESILGGNSNESENTPRSSQNFSHCSTPSSMCAEKIQAIEMPAEESADTKGKLSSTERMIGNHLQDFMTKKSCNRVRVDTPLDKMKASLWTSDSQIDYREHEKLARLVFDHQQLLESLKAQFGPEFAANFNHNQLSEELLRNLPNYIHRLSSGDMNFGDMKKSGDQAQQHKMPPPPPPS
ncbi:MAG: hypothetical protein MHPSP_001882, partial [Paramarteilia canceri]